MNSKATKVIKTVVILAFFLLLLSYHLQSQLIETYNKNVSLIVKDRFDKEISILPNEKGFWNRYLNQVPDRFKELLIKKEDKYFYYHIGFNPLSMFQAFLGRLHLSSRQASSTITQQLAKILLGKESQRNLKNKIIETAYAFSLELFQSKEDILKMYVNSIYFGNQAQGLAEASKLYFDNSAELLTDSQIVQLLTTINSPTENNPAQISNKEISTNLAGLLGLDPNNLIIAKASEIKENMGNYLRTSDVYFELKSFPVDIENNKLTIDKDLTERTRQILERNVEELRPKNVNQGAVVIIKLPENEILTLIGSTNPRSLNDASQINMINEFRPIGSTIKPFIYLKAFQKGARPYSLVDDREYKYITALGFPLYPKNFDYKYRGEVTLHYALSNSLNVPAVKVLEFVGLEEFYKFLENDLSFKPVQDLNNYQLGIALGALEMKLMDLAHYFTIFPNKGILKELKIYANTDRNQEKTISEEKYVQLINKILNDRKTGIEQFGMKSWLNLFQDNYALKTGTSRDFRDSWIIGYTPDFLVAVWLGNADNTGMDEVSGQIGAGRIWSQVMDLLLNSNYNKKTPFSFDQIKEFNIKGSIQYGLASDDFQELLNIIKAEDAALILLPHKGDAFVLENTKQILLRAKTSVSWYINNNFFGQAKELQYIPNNTGQYKIEAIDADGLKETIVISVI